VSESLDVVPFVAIACRRCGAQKPRTYGRRGSVRYHLCRSCGCRFRSIEIAADELGEQRAPSPPARPDPDRITLAEVALLLQTPPGAVRAAVEASGNGPAALLAVGFPAPLPAPTAAGPVWSRRAVAAHLADDQRLQRAVLAARAGLLGMPVRLPAATTLRLLHPCPLPPIHTPRRACP
jgi:hypothetical protein